MRFHCSKGSCELQNWNSEYSFFRQIQLRKKKSRLLSAYSYATVTWKKPYFWKARESLDLQNLNQKKYKELSSFQTLVLAI